MPTEPFAVDLEDLLIIRAALNSAFHQNLVLDLADQYRKLTQRSNKSKITAALETSLALIEDYIDAAQAQEATTDEQQAE